MGNAGRVLMIPKGDYNPATPYEMLDCVYYNGRSYVCKERSTGNLPTNTTYWQAMTPDSSAEIQALTNYVTENNVKNILPNGATSQTINGVTYTVNSDGSITANGTASGNSDLFLTTSVTLKKGSYILSGGVDGGENNTYKLQVADTDLDNIAQVLNSTPLPFTLEADTVCQVRIRVYSGKTITNGTFKPMITDANITDPTYQPYAKTNVELTQDASWLTSAKTYYDANTAPTVKQNHYNVAKYFYDFIKAGESHTVIVRYAGGYFDTMIISKDSGNGLYCVDFCHADGLGKILYFRYNGTSDTFTDLFSVT